MGGLNGWTKCGCWWIATAGLPRVSGSVKVWMYLVYCIYIYRSIMVLRYNNGIFMFVNACAHKQCKCGCMIHKQPLTQFLILPLYTLVAWPVFSCIPSFLIVFATRDIRRNCIRQLSPRCLATAWWWFWMEQVAEAHGSKMQRPECMGSESSMESALFGVEPVVNDWWLLDIDLLIRTRFTVAPGRCSLSQGTNSISINEYTRLRPYMEAGRIWGCWMVLKNLRISKVLGHLKLGSGANQSGKSEWFSKLQIRYK